MPARSTFTEEKRETILQVLRIGGSGRTAAAAAGVPHTTYLRWLAKGRAASPGTRFHEFAEQVEEAEAAPRVRALGVVYRELPDNPLLAWKFLQAREPGFAPPGRERKDEAPEPEPVKTVTDELAERRRSAAR